MKINKTTSPTSAATNDLVTVQFRKKSPMGSLSWLFERFLRSERMLESARTNWRWSGSGLSLLAMKLLGMKASDRTISDLASAVERKLTGFWLREVWGGLVKIYPENGNDKISF